METSFIRCLAAAAAAWIMTYIVAALALIAAGLVWMAVETTNDSSGFSDDMASGHSSLFARMLFALVLLPLLAWALRHNVPSILKKDLPRDGSLRVAGAMTAMSIAIMIIAVIADSDSAADTLQLVSIPLEWVIGGYMLRRHMSGSSERAL